MAKHLRSLSITRSPSQKTACKDLRHNGQSPAITPEAAYTPTSNRGGSRSAKKLPARENSPDSFFKILVN
ncbi:ATP-dependent nuclease subunit B [Lacticaseibacillus rhamnosus]|nr:ATP-dependent nuclease subunit B [Lacticaseibacillus rhamnosus]TXJ99558.1 ATP-dependent nuclease subunit B [Lacticaseibacillus rhamnosus]